VLRLATIPPSVSRLSRGNVGASTSHTPIGLHGLLQGQLYLFREQTLFRTYLKRRGFLNVPKTRVCAYNESKPLLIQGWAYTVSTNTVHRCVTNSPPKHFLCNQMTAMTHLYIKSYISKCRIDTGVTRKGNTIDHWRSQCKGRINMVHPLCIHSFIHSARLNMFIQKAYCIDRGGLVVRIPGYRSRGPGSRKTRLSAVGIRCPDHATSSICKSWH
jgi:hypothetical protein